MVKQAKHRKTLLLPYCSLAMFCSDHSALSTPAPRCEVGNLLPTERVASHHIHPSDGELQLFCGRQIHNLTS